ncbi:MAG: GspH/FimT family pseudopilin [Phycisphaeraceae bacterium]|nr:GspH/FimT family pseudopilin [Phycisphaeraceae bacterium]
MSLVELAIVIVVIGIISAVALPRFGGSNADARLRAASLRIERDLALARQHAIATSAPVTVTFTAGGYSIPALPALERRASGYAVSLRESPFLASLTSIKAGPGDTLTFDMHGTPSGNCTLELTAAGRTVTLLVDDQVGRVIRP